MKGWQLFGGATLVLLLAVAAYLAYKVQASMAVGTSNAFTKIREVESPLVGQEAPAIALESLNGGSFDLAAYRGKLVLVSFWSHF